ncbi:MAG: hypothetical protein BWY63_02863 [Chloroflexi bacterium ADurb.Bin360]|nr:MAG: hypothetical protein BWY63_02863 [Chloroflexi bacterium ADurb.Bin360]
MFGTSMPTRPLPGIGASIRMLRAERASARSSANEAILLTLTLVRLPPRRSMNSGSTPNCTTTGPVFVSSTLTGAPKLVSVSSMIRACLRMRSSLKLCSLPTSRISATVGRRQGDPEGVGGILKSMCSSSGRAPLILSGDFSCSPRVGAAPPSTTGVGLEAAGFAVDLLTAGGGSSGGRSGKESCSAAGSRFLDCARQFRSSCTASAGEMPTTRVMTISHDINSATMAPATPTSFTARSSNAAPISPPPSPCSTSWKRPTPGQKMREAIRCNVMSAVKKPSATPATCSGCG